MGGGGGGGGAGRWRERVLGVGASAGAGAVAGVARVPARSSARADVGASTPKARSTVCIVSDVISALIFIVMAGRTLRYIYRRKRGVVGPAGQRVLLRYWVCHALCISAVRLLSLWLSPLGVDTALSVIRAAALVLAVVLRDVLYACLERTVYDAAEPQVEEMLRTARKYLHDARKWCAAAGDEIAARYMVGGVRSVIAAFRGEEPSTTNATRTLGDTSASVSSAGIGDVSNGAVGAAVERSHVVQTKAEAPKAAYAASRELRESFRQRAQARKNDVG